MPQKQTPPRKQHLQLIVIIVVVTAIALAAFVWAWPYAILPPKSLGSQLQYVGKQDEGCWWLICDATPSTTYYFATDMTPEELVGYFRGAKPACESLSVDSAANYSGTTFACGSLTTAEGFAYTYHDNNPRAVVQTFNLKRTNLHFIVSIDSTDYNQAKAAL